MAYNLSIKIFLYYMGEDFASVFFVCVCPCMKYISLSFRILKLKFIRKRKQSSQFTEKHRTMPVSKWVLHQTCNNNFCLFFLPKFWTDFTFRNLFFTMILRSPCNEECKNHNINDYSEVRVF